MLKDYTIRPETLNDAEARVTLTDICTDDMGGGRRYTVEQYRKLLQSPGFNMG